MAATPCPGNPSCRCPWCYGLAEYMTTMTGRDYGLLRTWTPPPRLVEAPKPAPVPHTRREPAPQPWEPRPSRRTLRMAA